MDAVRVNFDPRKSDSLFDGGADSPASLDGTIETENFVVRQRIDMTGSYTGSQPGFRNED